MTEQRPKTKQEIERAIIEAVANKRRVILAVIQAEKEKQKATKGNNILDTERLKKMKEYHSILNGMFYMDEDRSDGDEEPICIYCNDTHVLMDGDEERTCWHCYDFEYQ